MFKTYTVGKKAILLLKADEFLRDRAIVSALRIFDGMVIGMSKKPYLKPNRLFDFVIDADPHASEDALAAVEAFVEENNIVLEAVIPITEMTIISALKIANKYQLPFLSKKSVYAVRDKNLMKEALYAAMVPTAKHKIINNLNELHAFCDEIGLPVIIKPVAAAHSIGVKLIRTQEEIEAVYNYCINSLKSIVNEWGLKNLAVQVEEFIDSQKEISVEIVNNGRERKVIAITDKSLSPLPYFSEIGHMVPSEESDNAHVKEVALKACEALDLNLGVAHVEIRIDQYGNPYVIELTARPGGDGIMDLVERALGVNMYELHIKSFLNTLGDLSSIHLESFGTAAIAFFPQKLGKVLKIKNLNHLPKDVVSLYLSVKEGDIIQESQNYDDRLGTIEFFWPKQFDGMKNKHTAMALDIRETIFEIHQ